jgi:hypothetical protein
MPREGAIIFSDLIGKLDVLRIEWGKSGRAGRYRLADLITRYGRNEELFAFTADVTANCTRKQARSDTDPCGAITADEALAAANPGKERGPRSVVNFLLDILANGPVLKKIIEDRAAAHGFSEDQLQRAKGRMGIVSFKEKLMQGRWYWALPQHAPRDND